MFTKFSTLLSTFKLLNVFANFPAIFFTKLVNVSASGTSAFLMSLILSRIAFKSLTTGPFCSIRGETNNAPIRPNADLIFEIEPVKVSLAFLACSPNALSIASAKVWKSILPLDTISRTSASVTPSCSPRVAAAFRPLEAN